MPDSISSSALEKFTTFGDLLRFLRRRTGITQLELSIAVGYSEPHISRLEQNQRLPDIPTIQARFIAPLCLEDEPRAVARLIELASEVRREDAPTPGMCPYKGMDYFDEADADLFVGRESLTEKLTDEVLALASKSKQHNCGFLAIVGASGSGKSSLVRAGLVPALRWNKSSANWTIHVLTPTTHPLENLAATLTSGASLATAAELMNVMAGDPRALSLYIKREKKINSGSYSLLVIDQFEELFALCHSDGERSSFISNLLTAAFDPDVKAIIVITLRADFYAYCACYPQLRQALAKHQEYIGTMSDEEMNRAIEEPARRGHWEFEPGLVDLIRHDVGHEPGALPLLSHALYETWQRRRGRMLTFSGYAASGGVRGAIAETAESVFTDQFTHEQQMIARRIFLRLTELGGETTAGDTRRRATIDELILKPEEKEATQAVLKALADSRLVTTSEDSVQVAHEALIREWPTLRGWLEDNRDGLRLHRQLTEAAQDWQAAQDEPDMLFRGARLAQAREWADTHSDDMNPLEKEFLRASVDYSQREAEEHEAQHQRELEATRQLAEAERRRAEEEIQATRKLQQRAVFLSFALAIAFILFVIAIVLARQATQNASLAVAQKSTADVASVLAVNEAAAHATAEAIAVSQQLVANAASTQAIGESHIRATAEARAEAESALNYSLNLAASAQALNIAGQRDIALLLALEAVKTKQPPKEALTALRKVATDFGTRAVLRWHRHAVQTVAISPDGKTAFSGSCVQLDTNDHCLGGELILWDLESLNEIHRWKAHSDWIAAVAYSLDGNTMISGSRDGSLLLWNTQGEQTGQLVGHTDSISDLALVSGSGYLLSGSLDGSLIMWDLRSKKAVRNFNKVSSPIMALAVASANPTAVTAHQDGSLIMWDLENTNYLLRFQGSSVSIRSVAITPDASRILFTIGTVPEMFLRIIDGNTGNIINEKHFACNPGDLVPSPDFRTVLMSCLTTVQKIDADNLNVLEISFDPPYVLNALAINSDGTLALSASQDRTLRVWNIGDPDIIQSTDVDVDELTAFAASPDGKYLLMSDASKNGFDEPVLWHIAKREVVRTYPGFDGSVFPGAVTISPDGHFVAVAGSLNIKTPRVMIWDFESGNFICNLTGLTEVGRAVAFSPDSLYLLVGSQVPGGTVGHLILWDLKTCKKVRNFNTEEEITSIQFSRDGSHALTGSSQLGRAVLWDIATGQEIKRFSYARYGPIMAATFGPDDTTVLGTGTGEIYLWDVNTENLIRRYTGINSVPFCVTISPDGKYMLSGDTNGDVILWDFATGEQLINTNLQNMVFSVAFSPDGKTAYAASVDGKLIELPIVEKSLPELLEWVKQNRYVRELTEAEKIQYHIKP